jgi:hypothetical protein
MADAQIDADFSRKRKRLLRLRQAQLNHIYAKAIGSGELSVARAVLNDSITLERLWPDPEAERLQREIDSIKKMINESNPRNADQPYANDPPPAVAIGQPAQT